jgi:polyisoprenoid-binding protein YceI
MQLQRSLALALGLAALVSSPAIGAETYTLDAAHSEVGFNVGYFKLFKVHGAFAKFSGTVLYDAKDPAKSSVDVTIDAASIDTRNEMRDKHLRSDDFFDVEKYPVSTFRSTKVEVAKDGSLTITGDLSLHGVTKPVVLNATILGTLEDNMGREQLAFSATTTFNRFDFGIAYDVKNKVGTARVSNEVEIAIQGEAYKGAARAMGAKPVEAKK